MKFYREQEQYLKCNYPDVWKRIIEGNYSVKEIYQDYFGNQKYGTWRDNKQLLWLLASYCSLNALEGCSKTVEYVDAPEFGLYSSEDGTLIMMINVIYIGSLKGLGSKCYGKAVYIEHGRLYIINASRVQPVELRFPLWLVLRINGIRITMMIPPKKNDFPYKTTGVISVVSKGVSLVDLSTHYEYSNIANLQALIETFLNGGDDLWYCSIDSRHASIGFVQGEPEGFFAYALADSRALNRNNLVQVLLNTNEVEMLNLYLKYVLGKIKINRKKLNRYGISYFCQPETAADLSSQ
ncbi:MAG: hypothetical protein LKF79_05080 [Solobacterium sp.]|nr:hypothetical protein [Solobacterium sp.]MCH4223075.1 hypothetical protein [Solobacterium sp.]MCH4265996.1 hypothetical protein [Solobacterium sp.]